MLQGFCLCYKTTSLAPVLCTEKVNVQPLVAGWSILAPSTLVRDQCADCWAVLCTLYILSGYTWCALFSSGSACLSWWLWPGVTEPVQAWWSCYGVFVSAWSPVGVSDHLGAHFTSIRAGVRTPVLPLTQRALGRIGNTVLSFLL